ncbi:hypothetical protein K435DRAFT_784492 [Dendrothele bispora CBS 962.96]|uniref:Uncharacterized protein n=1 Tax=Dendrothele bispora (strain CBS 962.96) TaxID=1314807 RepID=A0A4S8L2T4_DENBC|nr:hypothetical protein K435DRAFT_784550 [Dendrothele bispora CBS 962.96]THU82784.1 hypothetical protein K435DRAFT_784492 [Dendrothele bispora CBS 962.96]
MTEEEEEESINRTCLKIWTPGPGSIPMAAKYIIVQRTNNASHTSLGTDQCPSFHCISPVTRKKSCKFHT